LGLAAALTTVSPVAAQPVRAIVVVLSGSGASDSLAMALGRLAEARGVAFIDHRPPQVEASRVRALVGRAIDSYQGFRYPEAVGLLDQAVTALEGGDVVGVDPAVIADVFIYRGLARFALGDREAAWGDFVSAATVGPGRILDPVRFPPSAVETFERARAEVAKAARGAVSLQVPEGCRAAIDGIAYQGPRVLALGHHFYGVECRGQRVGGRFEASGELVSLTPPLVEVRSIDLEQASALASERGGAQLIWVDVAAAEPPTAVLQSVDFSTRTIRKQVAMASPAAVATVVNKFFEPPAELVKVEPEPRRWYKEPWLWAAVGAAVATVVILPLTVGGNDAGAFSVEPTGALPR